MNTKYGLQPQGAQNPQDTSERSEWHATGLFRVLGSTVKLQQGRVAIWTGLSAPGQGKACRVVGPAGPKASMLGSLVDLGRSQGGSGQQSLGKERLPDALDSRCIALGVPHM